MRNAKSGRHDANTIVCLQRELGRRKELWAQLEEKYGENSPSTGCDSTIKAVTHGWHAAGHLQVEVLEAQELATTRPASMLSIQSAKTNVKAFVTGQRAEGVTKSTTWRTGHAPVWNDKLTFERCAHDDTVVFQVQHPLHSTFTGRVADHVCGLHRLCQQASAECFSCELDLWQRGGAPPPPCSRPPRATYACQRVSCNVHRAHSHSTRMRRYVMLFGHNAGL